LSLPSTRIIYKPTHIIERNIMKTLSFAVLLLTSLMFVLLGCSDNSVLPVSSSNQIVGTPGSLSKSSHSVSGNIHTLVRIADATNHRRWSCFTQIDVSATLGQNNVASGNIRFRHIGTPPPYSFPEHSGRIIQLIVEENPGVGTMAKIMYEVTRGVDLFPPPFGRTPVGCLVLVDGGEGNNALPDNMSALIAVDSPEVMQLFGFYDMTPSEYIEFLIPMLPFFGLDSPYLPVDNGNVQVR
jgi:hypothetical protein